MIKDLVNEHDFLESVIIHKPSYEMNSLTPKNLNSEDQKNYLLFDDILYLKKAESEHTSFTNIIKVFTGEENCIELTSLLYEVLQNKKIRNAFLLEIGYSKAPEEPNSTDSIIHKILRGSNCSSSPLPNIMFTRDLGISIGNSIIITWASKKVRNPENIIAKYIIKNHKLFSDYNIYDFHENHPDLALEGGDVTLINKEVIAIGVSERTSKASVEVITPFLYENGIKYIMCFNMPEERRFMHLDTVFSIINKNEAIVYPPFFEENNFHELNVDIITTSKNGPLSTTASKASKAFKELGIDFNFIRCGGEFYQELEQWTDGANAFCVAPGVIILYDRNPNTLEELKKQGYQSISADNFLTLKDFNREQKTVITIESGELSRGRGGPRCMTMPINRIK